MPKVVSVVVVTETALVMLVAVVAVVTPRTMTMVVVVMETALVMLVAVVAVEMPRVTTVVVFMKTVLEMLMAAVLTTATMIIRQIAFVAGKTMSPWANGYCVKGVRNGSTLSVRPSRNPLLNHHLTIIFVRDVRNKMPLLLPDRSAVRAVVARARVSAPAPLFVPDAEMAKDVRQVWVN
mmetsp:Transcript_5972/g.11178  ORF Transcript_5972/g.11178 Transcript_5972/m.11178 type:complete len:179 (-) Transcript_5972:497-1033(-)